MPSGTALLQSPGCNEGKARYETLGKHIQNKKSSDKERHFRREYLSLGVPPLIGAQDMLIDYKPRACALGYAGVSPLQGSSTSFQSYFDALALAQLAKFTRQASFLNLRPLQNAAFARH